MDDPSTPVLVADLKQRGIDLLRILWSDLHGVARGKDITVQELPRVLAHGVAFCQALMLTDLAANPVESEESSGTGWPDATARPDLSTIQFPAYVSGVAIVLADIEQSFSTGGEHPGPLPFSPRDLLATQVARLAQFGLTAIMAPELEFYICRRSATAAHGWAPNFDRDTAGYIVGVANDTDELLPTLMRRCQAWSSASSPATTSSAAVSSNSIICAPRPSTQRPRLPVQARSERGRGPTRPTGNVHGQTLRRRSGQRHAHPRVTHRRRWLQRVRHR